MKTTIDGLMVEGSAEELVAFLQTYKANKNDVTIRPSVVIPARVCLNCGKDITHMSKQAKFCSAKCRNDYNNHKPKKKNNIGRYVHNEKRANRIKKLVQRGLNSSRIAEQLGVTLPTVSYYRKKLRI